ncbi:eukaryotic membrane protein family-domain-containing protein [Chytridium lagenaria]|nr:eukaryotic membrane protein family-domain-containing protein [Chytridium lagenaria]
MPAAAFAEAQPVVQDDAVVPAYEESTITPSTAIPFTNELANHSPFESETSIMSLAVDTDPLASNLSLEPMRDSLQNLLRSSTTSLGATTPPEVLSWNGTQPISPMLDLLSPVEKLDKTFERTGRGIGVVEYFWEALRGTDMDETDDVKKERVKNFLSIPQELEKFLLIGYAICLDSFLYIFTILPIRIVIALFAMVRVFIFRTGTLTSAQRVDVLKGSILFLCSYFLEHVDASKVYHSVRGQATIKLYVIFNVMEICDKLCSAFGHDILDSLFSKAQTSFSSSTTSSTSAKARRRLGRVTHFVVALCYVFAHTMVLFYQVMTLNVAVNSYNNSLLTLLLSNQFVEIKGSVFKRFERENLFQLSCSDVVERFQLSVFLMIIILRNFVELTGGRPILEFLTAAYSFILAVPTSTFTFPDLRNSLPHLTTSVLGMLHETFSSTNVEFLKTLLYPALAVLGTEIIVDWLKHAFITKFNQIPPTVYTKFYDSLCRDMANVKQRGEGLEGEIGLKKPPPLDQSPAVARRIGFVSIPLACLVIRVAWQTFRMLCTEAGVELFVDLKPPTHVLDSIRPLLTPFSFLDVALNSTRLPEAALIKESVENQAAWMLGFFASPTARGWLVAQMMRIFARILLLLVFYSILLIIKLNVGVSLLKVSRNRVLKASKVDAPSASSHFFETPILTPRPGTASKELPLVSRDIGIKGSGDKNGGKPEQGLVDPAVRDEKLDRVDRFLMVKSRIV